MKLSTKGEYGLRAMIDIAENSKDGKFVSINDIVMRQGISYGYLEKIISKLKKAGLVKSGRGASGGYLIGMDPKDINMFDILTVLENTIDIIKCVDEQIFNKCSGHCNCKARKLWVKVNNAVEDVLKSTTLEEMMK